MDVPPVQIAKQQGESVTSFSDDAFRVFDESVANRHRSCHDLTVSIDCEHAFYYWCVMDDVYNNTKEI